MNAWMKNNLAMMKNGLPVLCESCPCQELVYPSIYEYFPFWLGLGDYSIGWINAGWEKLTIYEYDPDTDLWIDPPYFECAGQNDARVVYYFGFTQALWASCSGRDEFATGAKKTCIPGISECPPPPYYFNVFSRYGINPKDRHELRFDFSDLPEKLAGTGDAQALQIKPGHKYTFKAYDITESPEELFFEGKILLEFPAFELHIFDVENPAIDYYAYAINYGDYPYEYKSRTTPFSVYDMDDNLVFSSYGWNEIAQVNALGCLEDIKYSVLAKCSFSGQDCSGCLKDIEFQVTTDFMASRLAGDCKNITNIERKGSYKYTLVASGFDTRAEAENYLDENHDGLYAQMKSQCAGGSWYIIGICECNDDTCEQCTMVDGSITIKCEDEIEDCFEDGGTYYKHTKLADGKTFSDYMSAIEYLTENFDDLEDELGELCSPCEDVTLAMTITWSGNPAAAGIWTRTVDGILEIDLMGHWWRNGQKIIECTGVNYNEYSNGWEISAGGFSGCIRFSSSYTRMEWEVGDYEDWYMTSSFYNIFRDGYWETAAMDSYVTQYNGHTHSTICSEYHSCHEGPLGCDNGVSHNGIHCVAINSKNLDGSGSVQNVFNGGGNSIVCTVNMSYSLSGASR